MAAVSRAAMDVEVRTDAAFYLTGRRAGEAEGLGLRPALFAAYRDLAALRYDFPLLLLDPAPGGRIFEPLSALVDREIEGGADRAKSLRRERELRAAAAAAAHVAVGKVAGELAECDERLPARLLAHVWQAVQDEKAAAFHRHVERLALRLADILRADEARSPAARSAERLRASFGETYGPAFDFQALSRVLGSVPVQSSLAEARRQRVEGALEVLRTQRFYATGPGALEFRFGRCTEALAAWRERLPEMLRLAKALTVAELEADGAYRAERHDELYERLAAGGLDPRDLALFPDYLVCLREDALRGAERDALLEILALGLPVKVLAQHDDLLAATLDPAGHAPVGAGARQLAHAALGLGHVHVLQASAARLAQLREPLIRAVREPGAALVSVFSGAGGRTEGLPAYLVAAAATESRAFPSFVYNPAAGGDWASRFSLAGNPQPERDWPAHALVYEDADHQRVQETVGFTLMEFAACDARFAAHFAPAARAAGAAGLAPALACLDRDARGVPDTLPALLMVDDDNRVRPAIVDDRVLRMARACRDAWRSLQELGGIRNSHVERALAAERQKQEEKPVAQAPAPAAEAPAPVPAASPEAAASVAARDPDEPYIETPRCSTCNECIQINAKMFAYDGNQQARIVDASAGTYRQLVEAAESCQVAIIHPGKPKNPAEPGLEELLKRAEAFR
jgi:hypothetical protein